ncbi:YfcL family protein [Paraferrimonas sp. SM1919]|uniref:YfcL family protein n=1 Tax=Paraferrimonas sp. SM1919 TaxID=2662263 RepID=UPI0013D0F624|nr:YfcL family protein [Paraferrimonas sp. SM1919]
MLEQFESKLDRWIANILDNGNDDQVFASGYLQGHVAVALSELEAQDLQDMAALNSSMQARLEQAKEELNDSDFALVNDAWADLQAAFA